MKHFITILLLTLTPCLSKSFYSSEGNVSIELPDGWKHDLDDTFGFCIDPPGVKKGVRIHLKEKDQTTLTEGLSGLCKVFAEQAPPQDKRPKSRIIDVAEVKDFAGKPGLRVTSGHLQRESSGYKLYPVVFHYLFVTSSNQVVCICLYANPLIDDSAKADSLILKKLTIE